MLGHGVGTKIHENPKLYYKITKPVLKENMVITIEPGIYIKNRLGIRIEDTCLITKKGCIPLTKSPKNLIIIK
jgi:Xaa-Pro aminopeptidase